MSTLLTTQVLFAPTSEELRFLPEGPYHLGNGKFSWVAIQHGPTSTHGSLNIFDLKAKTNQSFALPGRPGFAFPTSKPGVFVVGCERSLGFFDTQSNTWRVFADGIDADKSNTIINDAIVFDDNLIFGAKDLEFKTKKAGLYLWRGRDGKLIRLRDDQICSNGKAIVRQANGSIQLLDIDTPTKQVASYELDVVSGKLGARNVVLDLNDLPFFPDGMTMTNDQQRVIISFYNPNPAEYGETRQYRLSDGQLERTWTTLGSPQATCPQLIEYEGKVWIVITTAVEHMPAANRPSAPNAGSLFIAETDFAKPADASVFPYFE
jgi:sugar lactone lactonase YvrE